MGRWEGGGWGRYIDSGLASAFEAEYKVDPLVQMLADVLAFKRLAMEEEEVCGVVGPQRQLHVPDPTNTSYLQRHLLILDTLRGDSNRRYLSPFCFNPRSRPS